jgi:hypothetical protein
MFNGVGHCWRKERRKPTRTLDLVVAISLNTFDVVRCIGQLKKMAHVMEQGCGDKFWTGAFMHGERRTLQRMIALAYLFAIELISETIKEVNDVID